MTLLLEVRDKKILKKKIFLVLEREEVLNRALNILGFSRCVPENKKKKQNYLHYPIITGLLYILFLMCFIYIYRFHAFSFDQLSQYDIDLLYSYIVYHIRKLFFIYNIHS